MTNAGSSLSTAAAGSNESPRPPPQPPPGMQPPTLSIQTALSERVVPHRPGTAGALDPWTPSTPQDMRETPVSEFSSGHLVYDAREQQPIVSPILLPMDQPTSSFSHKPPQLGSHAMPSDRYGWVSDSYEGFGSHDNRSAKRRRYTADSLELRQQQLHSARSHLQQSWGGVAAEIAATQAQAQAQAQAPQAGTSSARGVFGSTSQTPTWPYTPDVLGPEGGAMHGQWPSDSPGS
jgi:hypothetical protein